MFKILLNQICGSDRCLDYFNLIEMEFASNEVLIDNDSDIKCELYIAKLLFKNSCFDRAERIYNSIIAKYPNDFRAYYNLASMYVHMYNVIENNKFCLDNARSLLSSIINQELLSTDNRLEVYGMLSNICLKENNPIKAYEYCQKCLSFNEINFLIINNLNVCLRQLDRIEEGINITWDILKLSSPYKSCKSYNNKVEIKHICIYCVKWGTKYGSEYVNKLYNGVKQYLIDEYNSKNNDVSFEFICYTDNPLDINSNVNIIEFPHEVIEKKWSHWWLKACIFNCDSKINSNNVLCIYFDLDTVFIDSLSYLIDIPILKAEINLFLTLGAKYFTTEGRPCGINSSIILWFQNQYGDIYQFLLQNYSLITQYIYKFDHYLEMMLLNSSYQTFVCYIQEFNNSIIDYASLTEINNENKYSIICFPLSPKPHEICETNLMIKQNWK